MIKNMIETMSFDIQPEIMDKLYEHFEMCKGSHKYNRDIVVAKVQGFISALYQFDLIGTDDYLRLCVCLVGYQNGETDFLIKR